MGIILLFVAAVPTWR